MAFKEILSKITALKKRAVLFPFKANFRCLLNTNLFFFLATPGPGIEPVPHE